MNDLSKDLSQRVAAWLAEDVGPGDATTDACVREDSTATAHVIVREAGVAAGLAVIPAVYESLGDIWIKMEAADGDAVEPGASLVTLEGSARALLTGERLMLNLLQRLGGIATLTRRFVEAVDGQCAILDTRKTTPGLRDLEKAAVRAGGGRNHRFGLFDGILIKDNHIVAAGGIPAAVEAARQAVHPLLKIEVEVDTLVQLEEALTARADAVLLDNMPPDTLREAVALIDGRAWCEASGGITLDTVADKAATGVDAVSVGALTHSAPSLDIGLDFEID